MNLIVEPTGGPTPNVGGQSEFAANWHDFMVALEGGWMSGKTWAGARKLLSLHIHNAFSDDGEPTYIPSVIVAPTYANALDFDVPEMQDAIKDAGLHHVWKGAGPITGGRYYGPALIIPELGTQNRPSLILIRTADVPERITGWQVGAAWGDEPSRWREDRINPLRDAFIQLTGRVRHPKARLIQLLFTYTNEGDATRIYEEMHSGKPNRSTYRAATAENPAAADFYDRQKEILTKNLASQYLEGGVLNIRGGAVYPSFSPTMHVDNDLELKDGLPLHLSLDFNISPGMHGEIGQYDASRDLFTVVHEIHAPRLTVRGLVREMARMFRPGGALSEGNWPELQVFGDATGNSAWAATGQTSYEVLRQSLNELPITHRFRVPASNPPVVDRVNAMEAAMFDAREIVHYRCHSRCVRLIEDFRKLKRNTYGEIDKKDARFSHATDAEGYRVHYLRPITRIVFNQVGGQISV